MKTQQLLRSITQPMIPANNRGTWIFGLARHVPIWFWTGDFLNTLCQHTIVNIHTVSTHPLSTPNQHPLNTYYEYIHSTYPISGLHDVHDWNKLSMKQQNGSDFGPMLRRFLRHLAVDYPTLKVIWKSVMLMPLTMEQFPPLSAFDRYIYPHNRSIYNIDTSH